MPTAIAKRLLSRKRFLPTSVIDSKRHILLYKYKMYCFRLRHIMPRGEYVELNIMHKRLTSEVS